MNADLQYARLPSRALIRVGGADWRRFLQGLLTNDVETLAPGELRFAALLTPQGRLLHDLFVIAGDDEALLDVAGDGRDDLIRRLTVYRLRAKVEIAAADGAVCACWRPDSDAPGAAGWIADPRLPQLGWRGVDLGPPEAAEVGDEDAYDAWRLAHGVPGPADWGVEKTYPIEADFDLLNGIDFQKGCYVGQETTSRMKRRGSIKTRMLPIVFDGPRPPFGTEILAGDLRAGEVLSGRDGRAMALLRLDRIEGAALTAEGRPVTADPPPWIIAG